MSAPALAVLCIFFGVAFVAYDIIDKRGAGTEVKEGCPATSHYIVHDGYPSKVYDCSGIQLKSGFLTN